GFSALSLAGILDSLTAVNALQADAVYRGEPLSDAGGTVMSSAGLRVLTEPWSSPADWHAVFVLAADAAPADPRFGDQLRAWAGAGT
ncbi:hypothetical protein, partial [Klebsiella pneumoniae]|uniref:hypothetical protein n=1 Tax=Klebsiella pneumoniae TaxID=573 RepID=UPI002731A5DD